MSDEESVKLHDYTEAFKVRRSLRTVGKAHIPLKEGLFVDDIKVFGMTLILWLLTYTLVLSPPIKFLSHLVGLKSPTGVLYLLILFVPPVIAVGLSRRPIRHNLDLFGLIRASVRDALDDPVHRKGVPVKKDKSPPSYRVIVWRPHADLLPDLAARTPLPNGLGSATGRQEPPAGGPGTGISWEKQGAPAGRREENPEEHVLLTKEPPGTDHSGGAAGDESATGAVGLGRSQAKLTASEGLDTAGTPSPDQQELDEAYVIRARRA